MTTKVTVNAHAGWPVQIDHQELNGENWETKNTEVVAPLKTCDVSVWDGKRVIVTELKKKES